MALGYLAAVESLLDEEFAQEKLLYTDSHERSGIEPEPEI